VLVQLRHLQLEISDCSINLRTPGLEFRRGLRDGVLERLETCVVVVLDVAEAVVEPGVEVADLPLHLVEEAPEQVVEGDLCVGLHSAVAALKASVVVVGRLQNRSESDTRLLGYQQRSREVEECGVEKKKNRERQRSAI
jgi:hypothetical protein